MALRNGPKIVEKMKQVSPSYSESLAFVGKTRNLSMKTSQSLLKIASESSSRQNLMESVPFFAFDSALLKANRQGHLKLVQGEIRKVLPDVQMKKRYMGRPKSSRRSPKDSTAYSRRLKELLRVKIRTPRTLMTPFRVQESFQEAQKINPTNLRQMNKQESFKDFLYNHYFPKNEVFGRARASF